MSQVKSEDFRFYNIQTCNHMFYYKKEVATVSYQNSATMLMAFIVPTLMP